MSEDPIAFVSDVTNGLSVSTITADVTAAVNTMYVVEGDNGAVVVTLPATKVDGDVVYVKALTSDILANPVTITPDTTDLIDGVNASISVSADDGTLKLITNGTNWYLS